MSDISITASAVLKSAAGSQQQGVAGATITQGQALYIDTANSNMLKLADANGASPANTLAGIALTAGSAGQPILYAALDPVFTLGGTVAAGDTIWLSATPGGLTKTFADLTSTDTVIVVGVALSATTINLAPVAGGTIA